MVMLTVIDNVLRKYNTRKTITLLITTNVLRVFNDAYMVHRT